MKAKVVELTELENSFYKTRLESQSQRVDIVGKPLAKPIKIRECADLRSWWEEECDSTCKQLESVS